ncbi:hypothetical protein [Nitrosopumilus sp.]|uniref:hypothetical protein n=1 Tax=Nitrosopumilus sp. TaxID=2024843 RepID=UPI003B5982D2
MLVSFSTTLSLQDAEAATGTFYTETKSYRAGQPVTVILADPDLNLKGDRIDIYSVIDDPNSPYVDTVGANGQVLLEILIKDTRYKRCTVDGTQHGGLASTGFTLVETGTATGIFEGIFKMPSQMCDKNGTKLISTAGGSIELKYHDARDSSGKPNIFSSQDKSNPFVSSSLTPQINRDRIVLPDTGSTSEVVLSGKVSDARQGISLVVTMTYPDRNMQKFSASVTGNGEYRVVLTINSNSLVGTYHIDLDYNNSHIGSVSFEVIGKVIPDWIKNNVRTWSENNMSDSEFAFSVRYLVKNHTGLSSHIDDSDDDSLNVPFWFKNNAEWWTSNQISDQDFVNSLEYIIKNRIMDN